MSVKKEKGNREKKDGYAHDQWLKQKKERNSRRKQLWDAELRQWVSTMEV